MLFKIDVALPSGINVETQHENPERLKMILRQDALSKWKNKENPVDMALVIGQKAVLPLSFDGNKYTISWNDTELDHTDSIIPDWHESLCGHIEKVYGKQEYGLKHNLPISEEYNNFNAKASVKQVPSEKPHGDIIYRVSISAQNDLLNINSLQRAIELHKKILNGTAQIEE